MDVSGSPGLEGMSPGVVCVPSQWCSQSVLRSVCGVVCESAHRRKACQCGAEVRAASRYLAARRRRLGVGIDLRLRRSGVGGSPSSDFSPVSLGAMSAADVQAGHGLTCKVWGSGAAACSSGHGAETGKCTRVGRHGALGCGAAAFHILQWLAGSSAVWQRTLQRIARRAGYTAGGKR